MTIYRTREGDAADLIAWRVYGTNDDAVLQQLLDANGGLADLGPILPAGIAVTLPVVATPVASTAGIRLWD